MLQNGNVTFYDSVALVIMKEGTRTIGGMILKGNSEKPGVKPIPVQCFPPQIPHGLAWD
jgi:hypothetical protein